MKQHGPRAFAQVDVFTTRAGMGNPVAVIVEAEGLSDDDMARIARWTHLSETTFLLPPSTAEADYRVRIFTPTEELPFAGHPTLGSARAWMAAGFGARNTTRIVQECELGLIDVRVDGDVLSFAAPPLRRSGPPNADDLHRAAAALQLDAFDVVSAQWLVNGPQWMAVQLRDVDAVLAVTPDYEAMQGLEVGVFALYPEGSQLLYEARAFDPGIGEDPVTGSFHAGVAMWLRDRGLLPEHCEAGQGQVLGRDGRVRVEVSDDDVWIGGRCLPLIKGTFEL